MMNSHLCKITYFASSLVAVSCPRSEIQNKRSFHRWSSHSPSWFICRRSIESTRWTSGRKNFQNMFYSFNEVSTESVSGAQQCIPLHFEVNKPLELPPFPFLYAFLSQCKGPVGNCNLCTIQRHNWPTAHLEGLDRPDMEICLSHCESTPWHISSR